MYSAHIGVAAAPRTEKRIDPEDLLACAEAVLLKTCARTSRQCACKELQRMVSLTHRRTKRHAHTADKLSASKQFTAARCVDEMFTYYKGQYKKKASCIAHMDLKCAEWHRLYLEFVRAWLSAEAMEAYWETCKVVKSKSKSKSKARQRHE
eukprot:6432868-Amphidinium_carterae.1